MSATFFTHLRCSECSRRYDSRTVQSICTKCNAPLLAEYDLQAARVALSPGILSRREGTLWRYRELLPIFDDRNVISLGEGWTPLLHADRLAADVGLDRLFIKDEAYNPTGSFKARGISVAVSKAKELGLTELAMPSAGNAGGALAAYAARANLRAHVFVPSDTPSANVKEVPLFGARLYLVDGTISDAAKRMSELRKGTGWFDLSTLKEPYRLEGKKTMGYELAEQFQWQLPEVIVYPTGGGTGLIGMWKAFAEMEALGWISGRKPRMISVQVEGCAPIVKAFRDGTPVASFWPDAHTVAAGLRVPKPFADRLILRALRESDGTAVAVSDTDLLEEIHRVARLEGIFLCPEGAAAVAAIRRLVRERAVSGSDRITVFNTGSGYKYTDLLDVE